MSRNFGIPNTTARDASGGQPHLGPRHRAGTPRDSNSFAGTTPPQHNLAVVRGGPFIRAPQRPLNPVQELDAVFDHREFAACVFVSLFGVSVGVVLAIAVALLDWS